MGKTVYTLNVAPLSLFPVQQEIVSITYPIIKKWAKKIGADFYEIKNYKFNKISPTYEKFQLYDLSLEREDDYSIFVDSDALFMPSAEMPDWTEFAGDRCWSYARENVSARYKMNDYFRRDGRWIALGTWFFGFSKWTRDMVKPPDFTVDDLKNIIHPTQMEINAGKDEITHYCDDYGMSLNVAKYGLHYTSVIELSKTLGFNRHYCYHNYLTKLEDRPQMMKNTLKKWHEEALNIKEEKV